MISQTVEYALRAMSYLASIGEEAVNCATISRSTRIPQWYLAKVMRSLVDAELVRSFRGPRGGFVLARDADAINLLDIVHAVEPIRRNETEAHNPGPLASLCSIDRYLGELLAHMERTFRQTSLDSINPRRPCAREDPALPQPRDIRHLRRPHGRSR